MDLRYSDIIDGVAKFSENFELNVNPPNMELLNWRYNRLMTEEVEELRIAMGHGDILGIVDECCDVAFLAISQIYILLRGQGFSAIEATVRTRRAIMKVCDANLLKNIPTEKGMKVTKPGGWKAPDFTDIVKMPEPAPPAIEVDMKALPEAEQDA